MKRLIKGFLSFIAIAGLVFSLGYLLRNDTSFFVVKSLPFSLEVPEDHVVVASKMRPDFLEIIKDLDGKNIWQVDIGDLQKQIQGMDWVSKVKIRRHLPDEIGFELQLEEALLIHVDAKGQFRPLTSEGKLLQPITTSQMPDRPLVRDNKIVSDPVLRRQVSHLFLQVPNRQDLKWNNIAEVSLQDSQGLTLQLLKGVKVHLGNTNIKTKGQQVLRVFDYLKSQKLNARVIDASFNKKVVVRQR